MDKLHAKQIFFSPQYKNHYLENRTTLIIYHKSTDILSQAATQSKEH